jgi:hypothetical protein
LYGYVTASIGFYLHEKNLVCRKSIGTVKLVYFFVSFSYLLFRTVAVSLCAASIYDESRAAKDLLYAVPTESYRIEVLSIGIIA